jgi:hypothetical protein
MLLESEPGDEILKGKCSACVAVRFSLSGNTLKQTELLPSMFDMHLRRVHPDDIANPDKP